LQTSQPAQTPTKIPLPTPIFIPSTVWRKATSLTFKIQDIPPNNIVAQATADGKVMLKTSNPSQFHLIQKTLLEDKFEFFTHRESADHPLKVVLRGVPINNSTDELKYKLEQLNFDVRLINRFVPPPNKCLYA